MTTKNDGSGQEKKISPQRRGLYYGGMALTALGFVMFIAVFISMAASFGNFDPMQGNPAGSFVWAAAGVVLIVIGGLMKRVGARGLAGSGVMLDPEKARDDLAPYTQALGGMARDAAEAFRGEGGQPAQAVKVRCAHCRALNDEDARFCSQCGQAL